MESFEEVYQKYLKEVYCFLLRLSGDREIAEELTQQTFAIAFEKLENFRGECKLSVWLCQIAKHEYYAWTKKQKRYANKKDQASMLKQQEEIQQVYDKYGVSMMGGCLPLLIQMPFLFALYPVIYRISDYVPNITAQANKFLTIPDMTITPGNMLSMAKSGETMGYSAAALVITAILLPVLSAFTQYLNMKLSMAVNGSNRPADKDDPTAATMRTMNMTMPLFSLVMVFTLPTGIGIYWIVSAIVRMVQQVFINKHLSKMSVDDMIEKNKEKAQKKKEKRGEKAEKINAMAQTNTKSIKSSATKSSSMSDIEREEKIEKARANAKPGSLASKANMVKNFNENK